jgi:hypothetical protein
MQSMELTNQRVRVGSGHATRYPRATVKHVHLSIIPTGVYLSGVADVKGDAHTLVESKVTGDVTISMATGLTWSICDTRRDA